MPNPILYHFAYSTCSQKVRIALAEKGVAFESCEINLLAGEQHSPDYVRLNPDHVVPTLVAEQAVIRESTLINEFLDDRYAEPSLRSSDPLARYEAAALVRYVDNHIHGRVSGVPTHAILTRGLMADRSPEQIDAYLAAIPTVEERTLRRSLLTHGVEAPEMSGALVVIASFVRRLERRLGDAAWLSGEAFGLADAGVLPYVLRLGEIGLDVFWTSADPSRVANWIDRCRARPSFKTAVSDWLPDPVAATFARLAQAARPQLAPLVVAAMAEEA